MRSAGFSFYMWGSGRRRVRMTLLLVSATVRNRLRTAIVAEKLQCLWGKLEKSVFFHVSEDVLMSFRVAGVALCDIRRV